MNRNNFLKSLFGLFVLPFLPRSVKNIVTKDAEINEAVIGSGERFKYMGLQYKGELYTSYEHDVHGEAFYVGKGEYRRGKHYEYNSQTGKVMQIFIFDNGESIVLSDDINTLHFE